jgi:hypothetical protein
VGPKVDFGGGKKYIEVQIFWEGHKILKKSLNYFDVIKYVKYVRVFFRILWLSQNIFIALHWKKKRKEKYGTL